MDTPGGGNCRSKGLEVGPWGLVRVTDHLHTSTDKASGVNEVGPTRARSVVVSISRPSHEPHGKYGIEFLGQQ